MLFALTFFFPGFHGDPENHQKPSKIVNVAKDRSPTCCLHSLFFFRVSTGTRKTTKNRQKSSMSPRIGPRHAVCTHFFFFGFPRGSSKMAWNVPKCAQMSSNVLKWPEMPWNALKCPEMSSNALKCPEMSSNGLKCPEMSSNVLKCAQMAWNVPKCAQMCSNGLKCAQMSSNVLKCAQMSKMPR